MKKNTFKMFVECGEELKEQYQELLTPFFNVKMIKAWKKMIYDLQIKEFYRNLIWEYLNGDIEIQELEDKLDEQNKNNKC